MKNLFRLAPIVAAGLIGTFDGSGADGVEINHLSANNSLIRVSMDARYLLLPVEESMSDAKVDVLLDGKPETTFYVRLARNKVDYYVPFDISAVGDGELLLNVVTEHSRSSVRETSEDACWKKVLTSDTFDTSNTEKYRPLFHHTPLYGWMNDPNGMFYKDGEWHLYYQYNPYGSKWQNMTWGHSSSKDLVNWEHHPLALVPDGLGSIFSGSSVIDKENTAGFGKDAVVSLYTSAGLNQMQSLAHSSDNGLTFEKFPGNPVITLESEARDPNMFWDEKNNEWVLLLAHALDHEMLVFTSPDLKEWTLQSSFGKGLGAQDGVWECPDLLELPVNGTDEKKWVLICNLNPGGKFGGSATQYFVGDFDGKTFKADTDVNGKVPTKWMDFGKDHYATVSWSNAPENRKVVIGWMSNWQYAAEVPTKQFRSANTLPRDVSLFKGDDGQYYISTVPSPEVDALRGKRVTGAKSHNIGKKQSSFSLPADNDGVCEIMLKLTSRKSPVTVTLSNAEGDETLMTFDPANHTLSFDRTRSGLTDFSQDFPAVTESPTFSTSGALALRIFVDKSSIEVFDANGNFVMTNLVFPKSPYTTISFAAPEGKATLDYLDVYSINVK